MHQLESQRNVLVTNPVHQDFSVQRGEIGSRGVELEANASLARGLDLTASYSYTDAKVTADTNAALVGRKNGLVPKHRAALWFNYRLPADLIEGLKLGLGVRYNSKVPDYENVRWVPGVALFDARVGFQVDRHWEIALNARNLFDKKYLVNCSYGFATRVTSGRWWPRRTIAGKRCGASRRRRAATLHPSPGRRRACRAGSFASRPWAPGGVRRVVFRAA